jgi:hypothetical protein
VQHFCAGCIVPVGHTGLTINPEHIRCNTNSNTSTGVLLVSGTFERRGLRAAFPSIRTWHQALIVYACLGAVSERQTARDFQTNLREDQLRYVTLDIDWFRSIGTDGNLGGEGLITEEFR